MNRLYRIDELTENFNVGCSMPDLDSDPMSELEKSLNYTSGSRFNAAKRLEARDQRISWIVAMASAYSIILTVIPYIEKLPPDPANLLDLATVGLSIITLVSSLLVGSRRDAVAAEQHHRSALELNELKRALLEARFVANTTNEPMTTADHGDFQRRYNNILQKYSINHSDIDFKRMLAERSHQLSWIRWYNVLLIRLKIIFLVNAPIIVMVILSMFCLWLVLIYALPMRLSR